MIPSWKYVKYLLTYISHTATAFITRPQGLLRPKWWKWILGLWNDHYPSRMVSRHGSLWLDSLHTGAPWTNRLPQTWSVFVSSSPHLPAAQFSRCSVWLLRYLETDRFSRSWHRSRISKSNTHVRLNFKYLQIEENPLKQKCWPCQRDKTLFYLFLLEIVLQSIFRDILSNVLNNKLF